MTPIEHVRTSTLDIGYRSGGPPSGTPVLLIHGWPDDASGWDAIAPRLHEAGFRTVAPWLRGCGQTAFLDLSTPRDGRAVALAHDALELMDALGIDRFHVVGHDWGARTAYALAVLAPDRVASIAALSVTHEPHGAFPVPTFDQARRWWYQFFLSNDRAMGKIRDDPVGFARIQWDTWGPPGWYEAAAFERAAASFKNPDWLAVTLSAYRCRWREDVALDARYAASQRQWEAAGTVDVPSLVIQGAADECDPPTTAESQAPHFTAGFCSLVLPGVGHFPAREAPEAVAEALLGHLDPLAKIS